MKIGVPPPAGYNDLYQDRLTRAASEDGAVGFDEPGVFGLNRRTQAGTSEPPRKEAEPATPPLQGPHEDRRPNCTPIDSGKTAPTIPLPQGPVPASGDALASPKYHPDPDLWSHETGLAAGIPSFTLDDNFEPVAGETTGSPAPVRPQIADPAPGLVVAIRDGNASIVVQAPPLNGEGRALLRRLVRQILAERRLGLTDLKLNGLPLEADFLSMTGGSHGPRTR